jgi:hypothetical protein
LPLPEPLKGAILPSKPPGIWRMSDALNYEGKPAERDRAEGAQ